MILTLCLAVAARPVAVMIHGAGGGGWEYEKWRPVFERAGYEVVSKDLLPMKQGLEKTTLEDYVRQVEAWCPKGRPVVLIGASMGGALAMHAAGKVHPAAVVLVNSVPPSGTGAKTFPPIVRWAGGPLKDTRDSMPDSDEPTILAAWKRWRDESGAVMTALSKGGPIAKPPCPVLVVLGRNDTDVPPEKGRALAKEWHADLLEYADMSHVGPLLGRRAPEVARAVLTWLTEKGTTDRRR